jgi:hypothetical protein
MPFEVPQMIESIDALKAGGPRMISPEHVEVFFIRVCVCRQQN